MEALTYLKNLIRDPNIASITPTSAFGVDRLCRKMDFASARLVIEYGPATGVITQRILAELSAQASIIALDTNEGFLKILRERLPDKRLHVVHDSAENVDAAVKRAGAGQMADYVISGIPFTMLPVPVAENIVRKTHAVLKPGGKFLVYQFLKPEIRNAKGIHRYLPLAFSKVHREIEFRNIPPLRIYEAIKVP